MTPVRVTRTSNNVRQSRERLGLTQQQLAEACGVTRETIYEIERGRSEPGVGLALRLAAAMYVCVDRLFVLDE